MRSRERVLLGGLLLAGSCRTAVTPAPTTGVGADIATLASRPFLGRRAGTPGGDSAAAFVAHRYAALHLRPAFRIACDTAARCGWSYSQVFPFQATVAQNVAAIIVGTDSTMRSEYVVVGAHFDGQTPAHVSDPQHGLALRPGADDNASGTAAVLELARRFAERPIRRSIVVVGFDAEEEGLCGSRAFAADPPSPPSAIALMLNFDMIGRLHGKEVLVEGVAEHSVSRVAIAGAGEDVGLRPRFIADRGLSDHSSFADQGIAVISLSTGDDPDYHTTGDVAERVNLPGVSRVIDFAEAIIRHWDAASPARAEGRLSPTVRSDDAERRARAQSCGA